MEGRHEQSESPPSPDWPAIVKPAPHDYLRVDSVDHALEVLGDRGDQAKVLAGGQSLVPMMRLRLARPELLIDITRLTELRGVSVTADSLEIGATTTHADLERGAIGAPVRAALPIMGEAARYIGHVPIRTRGTVGGSISHADPSAEWCLMAVLLDAVMVVESVRGHREIAAGDFFQGFLTTALDADEMISTVRFPLSGGAGRIVEFSRTHGDFALAAAAVTVDLDPVHGTVRQARIAMGGVASTPLRASSAEHLLDGQKPTEALLVAAARESCVELDPPSDVHASGAYRRVIVANLVEKALRAALSDSDSRNAVST